MKNHLASVQQRQAQALIQRNGIPGAETTGGGRFNSEVFSKKESVAVHG